MKKIDKIFTGVVVFCVLIVGVLMGTVHIPTSTHSIRIHIPTSTLNLSDFTQFERDMIIKEAKENNLPEKYWAMLAAINKAEGNRKGKEFGILSAKCRRLCRESPNDSFEIQAGHCAWEIREKALDYKAISSDLKRQGREIMPFIDYFGAIYCPVGADNDPNDLNKNWIPNVKAWVKKIQASSLLI